MKFFITVIFFFFIYSVSFGIDLFDQELKKTKKELEITKQELSNTKRELEITKQKLSTESRGLSDTKRELEITKQELNKAEDEIKLIIKSCLDLSEQETIEDYDIYKDKIIIKTNRSAYTCNLSE